MNPQWHPRVQIPVERRAPCIRVFGCPGCGQLFVPHTELHVVLQWLVLPRGGLILVQQREHMVATRLFPRVRTNVLQYLQRQLIRGVHTREECHWSHACKSFKRADVGTNGILKCKILSKNEHRARVCGTWRCIRVGGLWTWPEAVEVCVVLQCDAIRVTECMVRCFDLARSRRSLQCCATSSVW